MVAIVIHFSGTDFFPGVPDLGVGEGVETSNYSSDPGLASAPWVWKRTKVYGLHRIQNG